MQELSSGMHILPKAWYALICILFLQELHKVTSESGHWIYERVISETEGTS